MDRPKLKKKIAAIICCTIFLFVPFISELSFAAEAKKKEPKEQNDKKKEPRAELIIYYGRLVAKDKKSQFLYVEPVDKRLSRMIFYIDSKTGYVKDGFSAELKEIHPGEKIAVRYLLYGNLKIAEEVFVVEGEFQPDRYRKRGVKRRVRPEKDE